MKKKYIRRLFPYALSLGFLAAAGALVTACDHASASEKEKWFGVVSAACGPADGPALHFQIDTTAYSGCGTSHPREFSILVDNRGFVDVLTPGQIVVDTQSTCPDKCASLAVIRIEILSVDSASVKADVRIESGDTESKVIRSGKVNLSRCPNKNLCG